MVLEKHEDRGYAGAPIGNRRALPIAISFHVRRIPRKSGRQSKTAGLDNN